MSADRTDPALRALLVTDYERGYGVGFKAANESGATQGVREAIRAYVALHPCGTSPNLAGQIAPECLEARNLARALTAAEAAPLDRHEHDFITVRIDGFVVDRRCRCGAEPLDLLDELPIRAAAEAAPLPETKFAWLIERGQPEGLTNPQWWGVTDSRTGAYGWTDSAFSADQFATRAEAEAVIAGFNTRPGHEFNARAVQHGFSAASFAAAAEAAPLDGQCPERCLGRVGHSGPHQTSDYEPPAPLDVLAAFARWFAPHLTVERSEAIAREYAALAATSPKP